MTGVQTCALPISTVDLDSKSAAVTCTPDVSDDTLRQAVEDAGYHVTGIR